MRPPLLACAVLAASVAAVSTSGCATPGPLVGLEPRNPGEISWVDGRAILSKEKAGVRVSTTFERQRENAFAVRVLVENETPAPIEVAPDGVTFMTCTGREASTCKGSWGVVDPEEMLASIDQADSRAQANASNARVFWGVLTAVSVVGDAASLASGEGDPRGTESALAGMESSDARHARERAQLANDRELWANVAFRRNTVGPGRGAGGLVFLPIDLNASYVWLHVRAGGQIFGFGFRQTVTPTVETRVSSNRNRS
jgi:hypothetical protein